MLKKSTIKYPIFWLIHHRIPIFPPKINGNIPDCIWWEIPPTCRWNFWLSLINILAKSVEFFLFIPMLPLIFGGKIEIRWWISQNIGYFMVDFFSILGKSVGFCAPNTDWQSVSRFFIFRAICLQGFSKFSPKRPKFSKNSPILTCKHRD